MPHVALPLDNLPDKLTHYKDLSYWFRSAQHSAYILYFGVFDFFIDLSSYAVFTAHTAILFDRVVVSVNGGRSEKKSKGFAP